ncbi:hypothetical protein [Catellatospora sp. NPDC049609]|uniref:hypothetical protein n=1 Tax=Catellatospora sp. NPDC049609 TaxID=3155505 RepID=UPI00343A6084
MTGEPSRLAQVTQALLQTGLFVSDEMGDVAFAHLAFAEFVAARQRARRLSESGGSIESTLADLQDRQHANLAAYTLVLYLRLHPDRLPRVIRNLLELPTVVDLTRGGKAEKRLARTNGLLAAARVILTGARTDPAVESIVINRLVTAHVEEFHTGDSSPYDDIIAQFGAHPTLAARLGEIAASPYPPMRARCDAAVQIAEAGGRDTALDLLRNMARTATDPEDIAEVAYGLQRCGGARGLAVDILEAAVASLTDSQTSTMTSLAWQLWNLGEDEAATRLAWRIMRHPEPNLFGPLANATKIILGTLGNAAAPRVVEAVRKHAADTFNVAMVAETLLEAGAKAEAIELARDAVGEKVNLDGDTMRSAIRTWLSAAGPQAAEEVVAMALARPEVSRWAYLAEAALQLSWAGANAAAAIAAKHVLGSAAASPDEKMSAALAWASAATTDDVGALAELLITSVRSPNAVLLASERISVALPEPLLNLLQCFVVDPACSEEHSRRAARLLVVAGEPHAQAAADGYVRRPRTTAADLARLAASLPPETDRHLRWQLVCPVLSDPLATRKTRRDACAIAYRAVGSRQVYSAVQGSRWLTPEDAFDCADFFLSVQEPDLAESFLLDVLLDASADLELRLRAMLLVPPARRSWLARETSRAAERITDQAEALRLRQITGWLSA